MKGANSNSILAKIYKNNRSITANDLISAGYRVDDDGKVYIGNVKVATIKSFNKLVKQVENINKKKEQYVAELAEEGTDVSDMLHDITSPLEFTRLNPDSFKTIRRAVNTRTKYTEYADSRLEKFRNTYIDALLQAYSFDSDMQAELNDYITYLRNISARRFYKLYKTEDLQKLEFLVSQDGTWSKSAVAENNVMDLLKNY